MDLHSQDHQPPSGEASPLIGKSELACESCRRRKAKCDRTLPCCVLCGKTSQTCTYPSKRLKPGPKVGISQQGRKRVRFDGSRGNEERGGRSGSPASRQYLARRSSSTSPAGAAIHYESSLLPSPQATEADDTPDTSDSSDTAATNFVRAISLSSLIHPTHESCLTPPASVSEMSSSGFFINLAGTQDLIMQSCHALNLSINTLQSLIDSYFENMTSFSLFHQPSFGTKIQDMKNLLHVKALFSAMFSFAARFGPDHSQDAHQAPEEFQENLSHERFNALALQFIKQALDECCDETPPFCLLQAMALSTFYQLTNGVRGRAWRLLGSCVRIAYELRLHLVDYEGRSDSPKVGVDLARWSADEERRRCWWTIWEMDVFASTIRRCPTAIDWSMNDTYLPVADAHWFNNRYHASCFLEKKPMERWKKLKKCGNESPTAWFIVINSLMRNAQVLSRGNLQGILPGSDPNNNGAQLIHYFRNTFRKKRSEEDSTQLTLLVHALRCTTSSLPEALTYRGENLCFSARDLTQVTEHSNREIRRLHSAKYSIYLMTQLARFMIYHHYAFGEIADGTIFADKPRSPAFGWTVAEQEHPTNCEGLRNCLEAADNILAITNRCADHHVQFVNPFLASTVWLATSLQILRKVFAPEAHTELTDSKCEILKLSCQQYTQFWRTPLALLENLDSLEERLILRKNATVAKSDASRKETEGQKTSPKTQLTEPNRQSTQEKSMEWRDGPPRGSTSLLDLDGMPSLHSPPSVVGSDPNPTSLHIAEPSSQSGTSPGHASVGQGQAAIGHGNIIQNSAGPHVDIINPTTYLDPSTYLGIDPMDMSQGLGDKFTWYLSDLMSESLSR